MNLEEYKNNKQRLEQGSYIVIKRKINDFEDNSNNDEITGFVKGVVALQTLLYTDLEDKLKRGE